MIKKYIMSRILNDTLTEYRGYSSKKKLLGEEYIGGLRASLTEVSGRDPSFKAYLLQKGYENFFNAINRCRIPLMTIYYVHNNKSGIYMLTRANNEEELDKNIRIIETSFYAVFPNAKLSRLTGREIKNILLFKKTRLEDGNLTPIINHDTLGEPGNKNNTLPPFRIPIIENKESDTITLGKIITQYGEEEYDYKVTKRTLSRHLVCIGITGSGKTTTVATILNNIFKDVNYIVLDFHNEYRGLLHNYDIIIRPGVDDEYAINPLKPLEGIDINEHVAIVTDIFADTYSFTHPQSYIFKLVLEGTINNYRAIGENEPNIDAFIKLLERHPLKSYYEMETKMALMRRLKPLSEGQARKAFIGDKYLRIDEVLNRNVLVELGGLREIKLRQIYSQLLLKQIYDYRTLMGPNELRHIIVIEEASYLVPYRRDFDKPTIAERMVNEMRKFGESIFLITQFPTQIPKDTIKNAGLILIHRLTGLEDLRLLQSILPLTNEQLEYLKRMETGTCVVKDPSNIEPFLIKIHPNQKTRGKIETNHYSY